jgi:hypothetical protein
VHRRRASVEYSTITTAQLPSAASILFAGQYGIQVIP